MEYREYRVRVAENAEVVDGLIDSLEMRDGKSAGLARPHAGDLLGRQTEARHIRAIADNANGFDGFE